MPIFFYILCQTVNTWISLTLLAMLLRSFRAFFTFGAEESGFDMFLFAVTEPVIMPIRVLMGEAAAELPLDLPFMATWFVLILLQNVLPVVSL